MYGIDRFIMVSYMRASYILFNYGREWHANDFVMTLNIPHSSFSVLYLQREKSVFFFRLKGNCDARSAVVLVTVFITLHPAAVDIYTSLYDLKAYVPSLSISKCWVNTLMFPGFNDLVTRKNVKFEKYTAATFLRAF